MSIPNTYEAWIDAVNQKRLSTFLGPDVYEDLETIAKISESALFEELRRQPVDVVGAMLMNIPEQYATLRKYLPTMASPEVQKHWTGDYGVPLLLQSCAFVRAVREGFHLHTRRPLDGLPVLDYGCGWGRLLRLMLAVTGPEKLFGCDPWHKSLEVCDGDRIRANIALSDYLPTDLPFAGRKFSLIYAFSVFTHLSERAADAALSACRKHIVDDGMMAITIRPPNYWDEDPVVVRAGKSEVLKREHALKGFAFFPHQREAVDGDITYGDTSISIDFIKNRWVDWEVVGTERLLQDVLQTIVFLRPR
ncbi:class I SAM-dependent methyltransferase [Paraburkholderia sediminicola]|uniref:class I SAM-dependent methyltransferase n=1 Tax=Paraburkholderia sediminicola TaxID=458836 RepID=UPI0038B7F0E9